MSGATCLAVTGSIGESGAPPALTNLLTDTTTRTMVSAARPAYLVPRVDPIFQVPVTRISDDPGEEMTGISGRFWGSLPRIVYPRFQAWNADESMIYLTQNEGGGGSGGGTWLDGETYLPIYSRSHPAGWAEGRWHDTDPRQMVYCTSTQLRRLYIGAGSPADNTTAIIKDFSGLGYSDITLGLNEGEQSRDSNIWPITATLAGNVVAFAYNIDTDQILAQVQPGLYKTYGDAGNHITPDGTHMCIWYDDETFRTYRLSDGALIYTSSVLQEPSHYALSIDTNGTSQLAVGSRRAADGFVSKVNVITGTATVICGNSYSYHTSCSNHEGPNANKWAVTDYWPDSGLPYVNELVIIATDGSVRGRVCHLHRGSYIAYSNEPHPVLSPTGKRIIFKTTWEQATETPVGVYVADFRDFQLPGVG